MSGPSQKSWKIAPTIPQEAETSLQSYPPILRQILYNRGYKNAEDAKRYLQAQPPEGSKPQNMLGIPEAVERIWKAIERSERIAVYGDYDADGVTATALLTDAIRKLGGNVIGYIPNRFDEGYGLNNDALSALAEEEKIRLVITVDCGVRSLQEAEYARTIGMDMIITDHHHPGSQLPHVVALIDPKQPGETYPEQILAGVGLAFKLTCALFEKAGLGKNEPGLLPPAHEYLDLVALGTVTDQVPLIGENRSLVRMGLEYIRRPNRQGVLSMIGAAQLDPMGITAESIGFGLGPRLNAAGRLDSALAALKLLLTQDVTEAAQLAQILENQNRERQKITGEIQAHAEQVALAEDRDALLLFAVHESYNPGVIGLAAARLSEKYYRPSIVAYQNDTYTRGSCRSIPEFHITQALDQCSDLLIRHGGHAAAAGFTVENAKLGELMERLKGIAREQLSSLDLHPTLEADVEVSLSDLRPQLLNELAYLEPTGNNNPPAAFVSRGVKVLRSRTVGRENSHLKLVVTDGKITFDAIAFRQGHLHGNLPSAIDLLYSFERNRYNGNDLLQLNVKDIQPG